MNIGLATDFYYPWIGGPSILLRHLGRGLAARGHTVSLLAPSASGPAGREDDGPIRVFRARTVTSPFGFDLRFAVLAPRDARAWIQAEQPDVVHIHHPFPISASALFAAQRAGIPVVATNHTIPECSLWGIRGAGPLYDGANFGLGRWISMLLNRCAAVATPTRTAANALPGLGYRGPVEVISNGVDTDRFQPGAASPSLRAQLGLDPRPIVLYTGRLDAEKQMDVWLRAASLLADLPVQFVVGGNGSDRPKLEQLATELGLGERLTFVGYVSDVEFAELYRLASVYFIASPVELQSISTLEALASGLPVVGANAGALPELVQPGSTGRLFEPGDSEAASLALRAVLTDPKMTSTFGGAGRQLALGHGLETTIDAYERFLTGAAAHRAGERWVERAPSLN